MQMQSCLDQMKCSTNKTKLHNTSVPVVRSTSLVRDGFVVHVTWVEPLELLVFVVPHVVSHILSLGPVHVSCFHCKPSNISTHKDHATPHNQEQGLKGHVVLQRLQSQSPM